MQDLPAAPAPRAATAGAPFQGLLRTKLDVPRHNVPGVKRGRLVDLVDQGVARGLAVVSAPAGFGKSTLLAEWASRACMPVAWLSLDSGDNDMHRFLLYCAGALESVRAGLGAAAAELLGAMPPAPAHIVMTGLINAMDTAGTDIALVLDDYQFIQTIEIHEAVRFLVDRKPPHLRLVIATREDPPLPLARLRSQGAIAEIRADDLRFTTPEAGLFLNTSMSLSLSEENVARLSKRTEGWIAGLQMAALSLQGRDDADGFIAAFGGTNRFILDYLAEEVFARQDEETRRFLLETSILGAMSASLCEAVSGRRGAQEMLERLDRANLFFVALDERRCWYRYHHLFGDLLRHRLERDCSIEEIRALRLRAGDWLGAHGDLAEAIPHYLAAGGFDQAARLIEKSYVDVLSRGGLAQLLAWCREIPEDIRAHRPALGVVSAWALAWSGRREPTEAVLDSVEKAIQRTGTGRDDAEERALRGNVSIIRALLEDLGGNSARAVDLARVADGLLSANHLMGRALVFYILGRAAKYRGDLPEADRIFTDFLRFSVSIDNIWGIASAVFELVVLRRIQGTVEGCEPMLREFEAHVDRHHARGAAPLAKTFAVIGEISREQGRLEEAARMVGDAVRMVEGWGIPVDVYTCLFYEARAQRSLGRAEEALATLEKARDILLNAMVFTTVKPALDAERVRNWLALGDMTKARGWADQYRREDTESPLNGQVELLSLARVRLADAASNHELDEVLVQAAAKLRRSGSGEALGTMDEAVRLSYQGGFFQTIVDEGLPAAELLRAGLDAGAWTEPPLRDHAKNLLGAF